MAGARKQDTARAFDHMTVAHLAEKLTNTGEVRELTTEHVKAKIDATFTQSTGSGNSNTDNNSKKTD